jgi:hypothetical protein
VIGQEVVSRANKPTTQRGRDMADTKYGERPYHPGPNNSQSGITLRAYIATQALQGLLAGGMTTDVSHDVAARDAVSLADALIAILQMRATEAPGDDMRRRTKKP